MGNICSELRYAVKRDVAKQERTSKKSRCYQSGMLATWLKEALAFSGLSGAELARRMTARLGRSIDRAAVQKMQLDAKPRRIKADEMIAISEITGFAPPSTHQVESELDDLYAPNGANSLIRQSAVAQVHIRGSVQAGTWNEFDEYQDTDMETVPTVMGKWAGYEQFAYKITGPSMNQARIFDGDFVVCVPYFLAAKGHKTGDLVVVERRRGGLVERTVKQVDFSNGDCKLWPRSDDPRFQLPIPCKGPEPDGTEIEIIGLVIWVCRPL